MAQFSETLHRLNTHPNYGVVDKTNVDDARVRRPYYYYKKMALGFGAISLAQVWGFDLGKYSFNQNALIQFALRMQ